MLANPDMLDADRLDLSSFSIGVAAIYEAAVDGGSLQAETAQASRRLMLAMPDMLDADRQDVSSSLGVAGDELYTVAGACNARKARCRPTGRPVLFGVTVTGDGGSLQLTSRHDLAGLLEELNMDYFEIQLARGKMFARQ